MQGTVCAHDCGRAFDQTLSFTTNNAPTVDPLEVLLGGANNNAFVSGVSDFGHARVLAETDTFSTGPGNASMLAASAAIWTDYFTINSALAAGTVVQAMASIDMEGITDVSEGAIGPDGGPLANRTDAFWSFFASMQNLNNPSDYGFLCADWQDPVCLLPPNVPFGSHRAVTFNLVVGDVTEITGLMQVVAGSGTLANVPGEVASASVISAADHSAHFFLQPLGDFTLVSASGHDYLPSAASPAPDVVPEPTSMLLVGSGVAAMLVRRRRVRN